MKITSSPLQIVAVVAAVTTLPLILADRVAAGGVSTNTDYVTKRLTCGGSCIAYGDTSKEGIGS